MLDSIKKFVVGKKYETRSICDSDCIFSMEVISRTAKTITIKTRMNGISKKKIDIYDGSEGVYPFGKYSMSAYISAKKEV